MSDIRLTPERITEILNELGPDATYGNGLKTVADAATATVVREIDKLLEHHVQQATDMTPHVRMGEKEWEAIKKEARVE